jgi:hypothetical protein
MEPKRSEESKELINYDEELAKMAKKAAVIERPMGSTIGTKAGVLTYDGNPCPQNKLKVIVIASVHANMLYEGKFDPNNLTSPVCFAYSEDGENMAPHPASSKPQHHDCASCPMNQWKSDPEGGRGKACKNTRSLAVIPASTQPEDVSTCEIAILRPPVTSVKNWQMYVQKCGALYNAPPLAIITEVSTAPDQKTQYKVLFQDVGVVDRSMLGALLKRIPAAMDICQKVYDPPAEKAEEGPAKDAKY